jgi:gamma-glutamylaminecyclotransferase
MFHNGTFSHATYHKNLSDTNIISRKIRAFENMDNNMGQISDLLQNLTDSRVVFVKKDEYYIVNEKSGIWYDGLWLSKDNVLKNIPVFVYGTLRKHGSNYYSYMTKSKYLGEAETILKYNIREKGLPFLTKENKHHVKGDLFMVSQTQLEDIDILEGHPNFYKREKIKVKSKHGTFDAWAYFNDGERIGKSTDEYVGVFQHDDINYYQPDDLTPLEEIDNLDKLKREYSRCYGEPFPIDFADYAAEMLGYSTLTQNTWEKMPMHSRRMLLEEIYFEF